MAGGHAIAVSQGNLEIQDGFYTGGMSSAGTGGNGLAVLSGEESIKLTGGVFSGGAGADGGKCGLHHRVGRSFVRRVFALSAFGRQRRGRCRPACFAKSRPGQNGTAGSLYWIDAVHQPAAGRTGRRGQSSDRAGAGSCVGSAACRVCQGADLNRERWRILYRFPQRFLFRQPGIGRIRRPVDAKNIILDGGAIWSAETSVLRRQNGGAKSQSPLAVVQSGTLVFDAGAALQNNDNEKAEKPAASGVWYWKGHWY